MSEGPFDEGEADLDEFARALVVAGPDAMKGYADTPEVNAASFTHRDGGGGSPPATWATAARTTPSTWSTARNT